MLVRPSILRLSWSMPWDHSLSLVLAGACLMCGLHHFVWWRQATENRQGLWLCLMCVAAAGVAAAHAWASDLWKPAGLAWMVAAVWFAIDHEGAGRRRVAWGCSITAALAIGMLLSVVEAGQQSGWVSELLPVIVLLGAVALLLLLVTALRKTWASRDHIQVIVIVGIGIVLCYAIVHAGSWEQSRPQASLLAPGVFLLVAVLASGDGIRGFMEGGVDLKKQRQEIAHASRLSIVGELTASIAHEINQPLGAILSNADAAEILLERPDCSLDEIRRIFADIRRDGLRASDVIQHVRALVQKREFDPVRVDANAVVSSVATLLRPEASRRRMSIRVVPSPRAAYLRGDQALLEQVLINLVLNAMDALATLAEVEGRPDSPAPVVIEVASADHDALEISVTDAGPGIPVVHLAQLFDSFYTSKDHGMGLGLSIARSIVEAHGGRILAQNNPGKGAKFTLLLPPYLERPVE